jgi:hypothetical protein
MDTTFWGPNATAPPSHPGPRVFYDEPVHALCWNAHRNLDRVIARELEAFGGMAAFADSDRPRPTGVVEVHAQGAGAGFIQRVEDHEHALLPQPRVHVEHPVEVARSGAAAVDEIAFQDVTMCFEPFDHGFHHDLGALGVEQPWAAVTRLHAQGEVALQHAPVVIEMLVERFDGRRGAAAVVFGQRDEHPAHARQLLPGAIPDILPCVADLLFSWQRPVHLAIAHPGLRRTGEEVVVRHIQVQTPPAAPLVEVRNRAPLVPA